MHIKTNIEHNIIQIVVLAVCPLLLVLNNLGQAFFFILTTSVCYIISAVFCKIFNKYLDRNLKIFVTAVLSTFVMTILSFILKEHTIMGLEATDDIYYSVLATICLCLDTYFIDSRSEMKLYMFKVLFDCGLFALITFVLTFFVEVLSFGTVFKLNLLPKYDGIEFFTSIIFKLVLLGLICVALDYVYRAYMDKKYEKKIVYEKYVRKIRDEKYFQYDDLRKKKLLASKIEVNKVTEAELDEINQKLAENEKVELEGETLETPVDEQEKARNEDLKNKLNNRSKNVKESQKDKNKNSVEEKAQAKKEKADKKSKKKEKWKGSSRGSQVERVFVREDEDKEDK